SPSTMTSPRCTPMRNPRRRSSATPALLTAISRWISAAHSTASTSLPNSARMPSPMSLTYRPRWRVSAGTICSARWGCQLASVHGLEEIRQVPVERGGILEIDGVAGVRHHPQSRRRNAALHQQARLEGGPILVAGHDERGHAHRPHLVGQIVERGSRLLHAPQGERRALRRVFRELIGELTPAARVLVLELHARRPERIALGGLCHAFLLAALALAPA